jgi:hypothetical protein
MFKAAFLYREREFSPLAVANYGIRGFRKAEPQNSIKTRIQSQVFGLSKFRLKIKN